jgi:hypothetical protein
MAACVWTVRFVIILCARSASKVSNSASAHCYGILSAGSHWPPELNRTLVAGLTQVIYQASWYWSAMIQKLWMLATKVVQYG